MSKKVFITGVTGYIGGSVAAKLVQHGYNVTGLVRNREHVAELERRKIVPLVGSHADEALIQSAVKSADIVINAADSDDAFLVATIGKALEGTRKIFIQTSGSSIVANRNPGEPSDFIYNEDVPYQPVLEKAGRVAIDRFVQSLALKGVHSIVVCPCMIYGHGTGVKRDSQQIPKLIELSRKFGHAFYVGRGMNIWSNVHIDDLADLYVLLIEKAAAGSFFFAENGEASLKSIAESIGKLIGQGGKVQQLSVQKAVEQFGPLQAYFTFGSNSRISAEKARKLLGWSPKHHSINSEIEKGCYSREQLVRA